MELYSETVSDSLLSEFLVPTFFIGIAIYANILGKRDDNATPFINELAVGTSVLLSALGAMMSDAVSDRYPEQIIWSTIAIFFLFMSIHNDRFTSWKRNKDGTPSDVKHCFFGVFAPVVISFILFSLYQLTKDGFLK